MKSTDWIATTAAILRLPDLQNKIAVVTGASAGIGRATALLLLENGVRVFGIARDQADIKHPQFVPIVCDLSDATAIGPVFASIAESASQIDFLVNVAGIDPKRPIDDITIEEWDNVIELNLRAYYFMIKNALPLMRRGEGRSIVNVSSINYRLGLPGRAAYAASKAGILGLTTGLSRELGRENIRINSVSPGWIFTERQISEYFEGAESGKHLDHLEQVQSLKLKITSADIANHILFYLSNVSRASTGHNCVVDGGWILE